MFIQVKHAYDPSHIKIHERFNHFNKKQICLLHMITSKESVLRRFSFIQIRIDILSIFSNVSGLNDTKLCKYKNAIYWCTIKTIKKKTFT